MCKISRETLDRILASEFSWTPLPNLAQEAIEETSFADGILRRHHYTADGEDTYAFILDENGTFSTSTCWRRRKKNSNLSREYGDTRIKNMCTFDIVPVQASQMSRSVLDRILAAELSWCVIPNLALEMIEETTFEGKTLRRHHYAHGNDNCYAFMLVNKEKLFVRKCGNLFTREGDIGKVYGDVRIRQMYEKDHPPFFSD
jgi:hypothetical protein